MKKYIPFGIITIALLWGLIACSGGKTIAYSDIAGPTNVRELETIDLSVDVEGGTGTSIEWRVNPSDAGQFSPEKGMQTSFTPNPVAGSTNVVINAVVSNDQHGTVIKKKNVTIGDNTGWINLIGSSSERVGDVVTDDKGINYIIGWFTDEMVMEIGGREEVLVSAGSKDAFVAAINPAGDVIWAKNISMNPDEELGLDIVLSEDDYLVTSSGDGGYYTQHTRLTKLTLDGEKLWEFITPIQTGELVIDSQGDIYITGTFTADVDFDPGPGVDFHRGSERKIFLCKFTTDGDYLWGHSFGGSGYYLSDMGLALTIDNRDRLFVGGKYTGASDFDPGPGEDILEPDTNWHGGFLALYTIDGEYISAWAIGRGISTGVYGICSDAAGNIIIKGSAGLWVDFGLNESYEVYVDDTYVAKYNSELDLLWVDTWSTAEAYTWYTDMIVDDEGGIVLAGLLEGPYPYDFDPGPGREEVVAPFGYNGFVLKLDQDGNYVSARKFGDDNCWFNHVSLDSAGNVYVAGTVSGGIDFNSPEGGMRIPDHNGPFLLSIYD